MISLGNFLESVCFYGHFKKESGTFDLVTEPYCEISLIEFAFCSHRLLALSDHLGALWCFVFHTNWPIDEFLEVWKRSNLRNTGEQHSHASDTHSKWAVSWKTTNFEVTMKILWNSFIVQKTLAHCINDTRVGVNLLVYWGSGFTEHWFFNKAQLDTWIQSSYPALLQLRLRTEGSNT